MREPIKIVEIDMDFCSLTFGSAPCSASLSGDTVRKCFQTFATCGDQQNFTIGTKTLRFVEPRTNYPKGGTVFPCLVSTSDRSATVNIAGSDPQLDALGKRATAQVMLRDFPYHDRFVDKYTAGRIDGTAQTDEGGYNPADRGTFFTKLRARWPHYAGRPLRIIQGYLDGGVLTVASTRHYVITNMLPPDGNGRVQIDAKDILALADNDRAVAPATSSGVLAADISASDTTATLSPAGIGDEEYPASGKIKIGGEVVRFTRSGDDLTLTRAVDGTRATTHSASDTAQVCFTAELERIDSVIQRLLVDYAGVPSAFVPYAAKWQAEVNRWAPGLLLTATITSPTGVNKLIGELAVLGISIWWDEVNQEVSLKINRPPDTDTVASLDDDGHIKAISQDDRDEDRITEVSFKTVQIDVTRGISDDNFARERIIYSLEAKSPNAYGDSRRRDVKCRWLNHGADSVVSVLGKRLLNRFTRQPTQYQILVDAKDDAGLSDVLSVSSRVIPHPTGAQVVQLMQVIKREDRRAGHDLTLTAQAFQFDQLYGYITENSRPDFTSSSDAQKARGAYFADDGTVLMSDGSKPYRMI